MMAQKEFWLEVNCETDFVAKNEDFVQFSAEVANELLADPTIDLETRRTEQVAKIGENIRFLVLTSWNHKEVDWSNLMFIL